LSYGGVTQAFLLLRIITLRPASGKLILLTLHQTLKRSIFADLAAHKTSEVLACLPVKIVNVVDFGSLATLAKNVKIELSATLPV
jgi:hypothetical protein